MRWEVEGTDEFAAWYRNLDDINSARADAAIELLEEHGPALRRPLAGIIYGSRQKGMLELIVPGSHIRILYRWDPRNHAIILLAGNKEGRWREWYDEAIPHADRL